MRPPPGRRRPNYLAILEFGPPDRLGNRGQASLEVVQHETSLPAESTLGGSSQ